MATKKPAVDPWADWTPPQPKPAAPEIEWPAPPPVVTEPHTVELGSDGNPFALGAAQALAREIDPEVMFETYYETRQSGGARGRVVSDQCWRAVFPTPEDADRYRAEHERRREEQLAEVRARYKPHPAEWREG